MNVGVGVHCRAMIYGVVQYSVEQYRTMQCNVVQCYALKCNPVQCSAVHNHSAVQWCVVVQCSAVQWCVYSWDDCKHCNMRHRTVLYSTVYIMVVYSPIYKSKRIIHNVQYSLYNIQCVHYETFPMKTFFDPPQWSDSKYWYSGALPTTLPHSTKLHCTTPY